MRKKKYLVKWRGLSYRDCTWESAVDIDDDELISAYKELNDNVPPEPPMTQLELGMYVVCMYCMCVLYVCIVCMGGYYYTIIVTVTTIIIINTNTHIIATITTTTTTTRYGSRSS